MTLTRPHLFRLGAVLAAFAAMLGVVSLMQRGAASAPIAPRQLDAAAPAGSTDAQVATYQRMLRADRGDVDAYASLAAAYLQKVRETGDASFYGRAAAVLATARSLGPANYRVLSELGTLALARHDFRGALRLGLAARRADPASLLPFPVIVDAEIELGRYGAAGVALQRLIDRKPTLAAYARASYYRELHGDVDGAIAAMRLAVAAGGDAPENTAYVQTLLGNLEFDRGDLTAASYAYRFALARFPGYAAATAGLARLDAAQGRLRRAIDRYRGLVARLPLPEYVVGLGETELAAGRVDAARRDLALVRVEERLLRANGVDTDVDLALFEANHGSADRALTLARRAWRAAPSVRSADALGWALTRRRDPRAGYVWARRALALGSRDPLLLYHAAIAARGAGDRASARRLLSRALSLNPRFSALYAPRARRALESL